MTIAIDSGIIVIDKHADITSARVVALLKKLTGAKKAGHTGTLDPFATGVLICCLNEATKISSFFLGGDKKYQAKLCLGISTDTQDFTGKILSTCNELSFSGEDITDVFNKYEGDIEQIPPVYSALKHKGVPLYKLAREGRPVEKPARKVYVHYLKILEINLPEIFFEVSCSGGTYIRTLCYDIGKDLGCGGHLKELRRIESCGFSISEASTIEELEKLALSDSIRSKVIKMADALKNIPGCIANDILIEKISRGRTITDEDIKPDSLTWPDGFIKIVTGENELIAVLNRINGKFVYCCVINR
ncbi:MAG: tRNA pseudouridine(55) synthase TruB [Desulfobacterales bacterium]